MDKEAEKPHLAWAISSNAERFPSRKLLAQGCELEPLPDPTEISVSDPNPEVQEPPPPKSTIDENDGVYSLYDPRLLENWDIHTLSVPYRVGWKFTAFAHNSCDPTSRSTFLFGTERCNLSPLARCREFPPMPGLPVQNPHTLDFRVQEELQVSEENYAQVFIVSLCGMTETDSNIHYEKEQLTRRQFVAKVYDPLYGDDERGHIDLNALMDNNFTREAAVYNRLKDLEGHEIPEYYGAYSICLSSHPGLYRHVRIILIEYIASPPMSKLDPHKFSKSSRQQIIRSIIDIETRILKRIIRIRYLSLRNILVIGSEEKGFQVVLIDLESTELGFELSGQDTPGQILEEYVSPLIRHHFLPENPEFEKWIDWGWNTWLEDEFGYTRHTIPPDVFEMCEWL